MGNNEQWKIYVGKLGNITQGLQAGINAFIDIIITTVQRTEVLALLLITVDLTGGKRLVVLASANERGPHMLMSLVHIRQ